MRKSILLIAFTLVICNLSFAQSPLPELKKVREIKLLESTREDVRRILADYKLEDSDDWRYSQTFSTSNAEIYIEYSNGQCSNEFDEWNVSEWIVTNIEISPSGSFSLNEIKKTGIKYSKFQREKSFVNIPRRYVYHDKTLGTAFEIRDNDVLTIYLFPPKQSVLPLCGNSERKKFYSIKSWFVDEPLKDRYLSIDRNYPANVIDLILSKNELIGDCPPLDSTSSKSCADEIKQITVLTKAVDPDNDVLTYNYIVSGGKIIGTGANVVWDLSGVKAGNYEITVGVDDSCGVCGKTMTKIVVVKECQNCSAK